MEAVLPHLGPKDDEARAAITEAGKKLDAAVKKIGTVSLTQAAAEKVQSLASARIQTLFSSHTSLSALTSPFHVDAFRCHAGVICQSQRGHSCMELGKMQKMLSTCNFVLFTC
jgi:hypothetical protein